MATPFGRFHQVWVPDFEFNGGPGNRPNPVCMVAKELHSGQEIRLWRDDLRRLPAAPFDVGPDSLVVAYYASAELGCFEELGWRQPHNILDLFAEHRTATNGLLAKGARNSLIAALELRGLPAIGVARKEAMRDLVLKQDQWSPQEQREILDYGADDVNGTMNLFNATAPTIDLPRALLRGRYMLAAARMERAGVPIDRELFELLTRNWRGIRGRLIEEVDGKYGVYVNGTFKEDRFEAWCDRQGIEWPQHGSGRLQLDAAIFRDMSKVYPQVSDLHQLRASIGKMRLTGLEVGDDDRNRAILSAFQSATGRNQPSNSKFIFGPATWMRGLIKPPKGWAIAYIDWSAQEIAIAAALFGDPMLAEDYQSGDVYLGFGKAAHLVPEQATKRTHREARDRFKIVFLATLYGMSSATLARQLGMEVPYADDLMRKHRARYREFWGKADEVLAAALLRRRLSTVFGWHWRIPDDLSNAIPPSKQSKLGSLANKIANYPMQAHGAEMMRLACIACTEAGIEVCAPVHDALLIVAPVERIEADVALTRELMERASEVVTGGLRVRTDAAVTRYPDRYQDPRGVPMWNRVMRLLEDQLSQPPVETERGIAA